MVLRIQAVMAPPTSRSPVVTGLPLLSKATVMLFSVSAGRPDPDDGQHGHTARNYGDAEFGLHGKAVHAAAQADDDIAQALGAEIDDPAHLHSGGVDVQAAHAGQARQLLVIVIAFMLHPGGQGHHGQVVGVHDVVDVAGKAHGELGHGDQQGVAAAGRRALDVHGGAAGGLAQAPPTFMPRLPRPSIRPQEVVLLPSPSGAWG
jgi:hypothetical protein